MYITIIPQTTPKVSRFSGPDTLEVSRYPKGVFSPPQKNHRSRNPKDPRRGGLNSQY